MFSRRSSFNVKCTNEVLCNIVNHSFVAPFDLYPCIISYIDLDYN